MILISNIGPRKLESRETKELFELVPLYFKIFKTTWSYRSRLVIKKEELLFRLRRKKKGA